ncbi:MAG: ELM1/GtrOC1 family putative glycosyltransferase [Pseudomonadota bacterium]|nr:ELM1/GtrOC1 family putative glycosyltransferase [Pseudomonadota bacterium]
MNIWWLTDGKAGHVAQASGLFAALARRAVTCTVVEISVDQGLVATWQVYATQSSHVAPDLLIGVGHRTHWQLLLLKQAYPQAKTLVLMRPSLPLRWFDLAMIPAHDQPKPSEKVLVTQGVLNPIRNQHLHRKGQHVILIGGASKRHGWDSAQLLQQLTELTHHLAGQALTLSTSRRTPPEWIQSADFQALTAAITVYTAAQTNQDWLFEQLQQAETVWVTEDSVSMLYEAWTAGCQIGLLEMPRRLNDRITIAIDDLIAQRVVTPLADYRAGQALSLPPMLAEADRAADWLLQQFIPRYASSDRESSDGSQH